MQVSAKQLTSTQMLPLQHTSNFSLLNKDDQLKHTAQC